MPVKGEGVMTRGGGYDTCGGGRCDAVEGEGVMTRGGGYDACGGGGCNACGGGGYDTERWPVSSLDMVSSSVSVVLGNDELVIVRCTCACTLSSCRSFV